MNQILEQWLHQAEINDDFSQYLYETWGKLKPCMVLYIYCGFVVHIPLTHWGRVTHVYIGSLTQSVQIMAYRLIGAKPLSEPMLEYN